MKGKKDEKGAKRGGGASDAGRRTRDEGEGQRGAGHTRWPTHPGACLHDAMGITAIGAHGRHRGRAVEGEGGARQGWALRRQKGATSAGGRQSSGCNRAVEQSLTHPLGRTFCNGPPFNVRTNTGERDKRAGGHLPSGGRSSTGKRTIKGEQEAAQKGNKEGPPVSEPPADDGLRWPHMPTDLAQHRRHLASRWGEGARGASKSKGAFSCHRRLTRLGCP